MAISRKSFLTSLGTLAGITSLTSKTSAQGYITSEQRKAHEKMLDPDRIGVLSDLTMCIGCRKCEFACGENNDLPHGQLHDYDDNTVFQNFRRPTDTQYTVVNRYPGMGINGTDLDVKVQCMHCEHPACVSACIVGALEKLPTGPVTYDASKCIGCRYCMVACPFQIPQYEYNNALTPKVMKCGLCFEQSVQKGELPACVSICPREVMVFGKRSELVELAHERIRTNPDRYVDHVYGEHEVGGTSWMYISNVPFSEIDLPQLDADCPAHLTETIQHGVFKGFSGPILLFGLLGLATKLYNKEEE